MRFTLLNKTFQCLKCGINISKLMSLLRWTFIYCRKCNSQSFFHPKRLTCPHCLEREQICWHFWGAEWWMLKVWLQRSSMLWRSDSVLTSCSISQLELRQVVTFWRRVCFNTLSITCLLFSMCAAVGLEWKKDAIFPELLFKLCFLAGISSVSHDVC